MPPAAGQWDLAFSQCFADADAAGHHLRCCRERTFAVVSQSVADHVTFRALPSH